MLCIRTNNCTYSFLLIFSLHTYTELVLITSTLFDGLTVYVPPVRVFGSLGGPFKQACWIWFANPATSAHERAEASSSFPPQTEIAASPWVTIVVQSKEIWRWVQQCATQGYERSTWTATIILGAGAASSPDLVDDQCHVSRDRRATWRLASHTILTVQKKRGCESDGKRDNDDKCDGFDRIHLIDDTWALARRVCRLPWFEIEDILLDWASFYAELFRWDRFCDWGHWMSSRLSLANVLYEKDWMNSAVEDYLNNLGKLVPSFIPYDVNEQ